MNNKDFNSQPYRMTTTGGNQRPEDDFFDKDAAYEAWEEQSGSIGGGVRRFWLLLAIMIVALIGIYVIYQAIRPRENPVRLSHSKVIDSRIDELELRLTDLEDSIAKIDLASQPNDQAEILERFSGRIDRLENSFNTWVEEAANGKEAVKEKKTATTKPKKASASVAKKKPSAPTKKQPVKKQAAAVEPQKKAVKKPVAKQVTKPTPSAASGVVRYHTVQPEENLYRISLKYNLSIDQLKKLNNLTSNNIITGQKLRISP